MCVFRGTYSGSHGSGCIRWPQRMWFFSRTYSGSHGSGYIHWPHCMGFFTGTYSGSHGSSHCKSQQKAPYNAANESTSNQKTIFLAANKETKLVRSVSFYLHIIIDTNENICRKGLSSPSVIENLISRRMKILFY